MLKNEKQMVGEMDPNIAAMANDGQLQMDEEEDEEHYTEEGIVQ